MKPFLCGHCFFPRAFQGKSGTPSSPQYNTIQYNEKESAPQHQLHTPRLLPSPPLFALLQRVLWGQVDWGGGGLEAVRLDCVTHRIIRRPPLLCPLCILPCVQFVPLCYSSRSVVSCTHSHSHPPTGHSHPHPHLPTLPPLSLRFTQPRFATTFTPSPLPFDLSQQKKKKKQTLPVSLCLLPSSTASLSCCPELSALPHPPFPPKPFVAVPRR